MKRSFSLALGGFAVALLAAVSVGAAPSFAAPVAKLLSGTVLTNDSSENALSIIQSADVGKYRSSSGAFFLDNTGNRNTGMTLYSDMDAEARQPLMRMEVTNPSWDEEILYIHSDSPTSRGLIRLDSPAPEIEFVETDQSGAGGKFELRVQHDEFQINSRRADDSTFEKKITMTHEGNLEFHGGGIDVQSGEPSTFNGGINITGGCLAIDGDCVDLDGAETVASEGSATEATTTATPAITLSDGAPDDIGCNSYTERGSLVLDHTNNRLYICNGPERGWDHADLSD